MDRIYLNNAAGAYPLAVGVAETVAHTMREFPRISGRDASSVNDPIKKCRESVAGMLKVSASQTALVPNATYALNAVFYGFGLRPGDVVITSVMEHNSVLRPLARMEDRYGVNAFFIPIDENLRLDEFAFNKMLTTKPRIVALTHASNVTGRINQVRKIFAKAKNAGAVTLLDASQSVGRVPVIPEELFADVVVFSGYKGLRGPPGTGAVYVAPRVNLEPVIVGGTGAKSDSRHHPNEMPTLFEAGVPNSPAFAGLDTAVWQYVEKSEEIVLKERKITEKLISGLKSIPSVTLLDEDPSCRIPIASFTVNGMDPETAGYALSESFGIECRSGLHCAPLIHKALGLKGSVRLSPSYMNTDEEIDYAIDAVRRLAK